MEKCEREHMENMVCCVSSGLGVVHRQVRRHGDVQLPGKLIDGSVNFTLVISALSNHQLNIFIVMNTDEVTVRVAVVEGNVIHLEDISKKTQLLCQIL